MVESLSPPPPNAKPKRGVLLGTFAVLVAVAAVALAYFALVSKLKPEDASARVEPAPPPASLPAAAGQAQAEGEANGSGAGNAAPSTTSKAAASEGSEIALAIFASAPGAKLYVDGRPVANPHRVKQRADAPASNPHEIRAEAEGFEPRTITTTFDRDRTIDITLVKKAGGGAPSPIVQAPAAAPKTSASAPEFDIYKK